MTPKHKALKEAKKSDKLYLAAPAPSPSMGHEDRVKYYRKNKGSYIKKVIGKDGKYVIPKSFQSRNNDGDHEYR